MNTKPNCYECKHRHAIPGDAHSECAHPSITETDRLLTPLLLMQGMTAPAMKRMNVSLDPHGIRNGWACWPMNFDPVWLLTCYGFEKEGGEEKHESKAEQ